MLIGMLREDLSAIMLRLLGTRENIEELEAIDTTILKNGALVFVTEVKSLYSLLKEDTTPATGFDVVEPSDSLGRWIRQTGSAGSGQLITDPDWYVDPVNGNDANNGITPLTPLKTYEYGLSPRFNGARFAQTTTVHQIGSVPESDVYWALTSQAGNAPGELRFIGEGAEELLTGVITAATPAASGTRAQFTVAGADFTGMENKRVRITAGGSVGAVGWIQRVVSVTTVFVNQPYNIDTSDPTAQFQVGDTIVVEQLPLFAGFTGRNGQRWDSPDPSSVIFESLRFETTVGQYLDTSGPSSFIGCAVVPFWLNCTAATYFNGCYVSAVDSECTMTGVQYCVNCSLKLPGLFCQFLSVDRCSHIGSMTLYSGKLVTANYFQMWDWTTAQLAALTVNPGTFVNASGIISGTSTQANTYGIRVRSGGAMAYASTAKPTVAGAAGFNVDVGGTQVAYAGVPVVSLTQLAEIVVRTPT